MYDSLTLWIDSPITSNVLSNLSRVQESRNLVTHEITYKGFLNNLRIKVTSRGTSISGSLPKYYFGNNLNTLNKELTNIAIQKLSDDLHLPIKKALVFKIEVGTNFLMEKPIKTYFISLGETTYYERIEYRKGLLYKNQKRALVFYDKLADLRRHRENIPQEFLDKNLLRYELKLTQRLANQLKEDIIIGEMLYQKKFYNSLSEKWRKEYFLLSRINKINVLGVKSTTFKSVKNIDKFLAVLGLSTFGEKQILCLFEQLKNELSKTQKCRFRKRLKELSHDKYLTEPDESLMELDSKVQQFVMEQQ